MMDFSSQISNTANTWEIPLLENFISIQGEGRNQGRISSFLRFKDCNLSCPFCDTKLRMETGVESNFEVSELVDTGFKYANGNFVFTGGEPTLQKYWSYVFVVIKEIYNKWKETKCKFNVEFETNGYKIVDLMRYLYTNIEVYDCTWNWFAECCDINLSPKGKDLNKNFIKHRVSNLIEYIPQNKICIKLLVDNNSVKDIDKLLTELDKEKCIEKDNIYLMPLGASKEELSNTQNIYTLCIHHGVNFSSRIHIMHNMY